jgi:hypothetical protein
MQMQGLKSKNILKILVILALAATVPSSANAQSQPSTHLTSTITKDIFSAIAATVGIAGGLIGLSKYFSDRQEKETREWQKVSIYRVLRENESRPTRFAQIRDSHRAEGGAVRVRRKDLDEDEIRRALLEMKASGIIEFYPDDSFSLDIIEKKTDPLVELQRLNEAIYKVIGENPPFTYYLNEAASKIAEILGENTKAVVNTLHQAVMAGNFVLNDSGKIAYLADASKPPS